MAGELILIVDDSFTSRRFVTAVLERQGYGVRAAADAQEALELLKTFHPHLILMDIQLPGMSGLDLTRCLKAKPETRKTTVVAFSGYAPQEMGPSALQAGCDGYIGKPIAAPALIKRVADYVQRQPPEHHAGHNIDRE